jgi:DNA-binding transcriptional ArsR family regulator
MPSAEAREASLFAALGDETRLALVRRLLREGPLPGGRLAEGTGITRQGVARHLSVLEQAGVVRSVRAGRERRWQVEVGRIEEAREYLDTVSRLWGDALERLRARVQEPDVAQDPAPEGEYPGRSENQ